MEILLTLVFGGLIGWLASIVTKRDAEQGWIANIIVGIVGAFIGNWIGRLLDANPDAGFSVPGLLWAFLGAVVLCVLLNLVTRRRVR